MIRAAIAASLAAVVAACTGGKSRSSGGAVTSTPTTAGTTPTAVGTATSLAPTPSCTDGDEATPAQSEGPFYTPDTPQKRLFRSDVSGGTRLLLTGTVVTPACVPIARALVDFWHCDGSGNYDNDGYKLRGHQFADANGAWLLDTIMPGIYPGRTRHIHVKVQAPNKPVLTTQLYFPGESQNASDGLFRDECVIDLRDSGNGKAGTFRFVLDV